MEPVHTLKGEDAVLVPSSGLHSWAGRLWRYGLASDELGGRRAELRKPRVYGDGAFDSARLCESSWKQWKLLDL
jgi:hypothetical protein